MEYWSSLQPQMLDTNIKQAAASIQRAGFILVRIDRNPGRIVVVCPFLWISLQRSTFLQNDRYSSMDCCSSSDDPHYSEATVASFSSYVFANSGQKVKIHAPPNASRPKGYFTTKQKSLLLRVPPLIKVRPIISHFLHPCRSVLRRVARALSILVALATSVREINRGHIPIWRMHQGTHIWLQAIATSRCGAELVEFDVEDCFLNTPRDLVVPALRFWMEYPYARRRQIRFFAISKDCKSEDHAGKSCSPHYWELSSEFVISSVEWELEHNSLFEVLSDAGHMVVLRQHKGLPIGGHLSAALVELVALYREATQPRPSLFSSVLTARYRDNYFAIVSHSSQCPMQETADVLSQLLRMPVKPVGRASTARFLETRLSFASTGAAHCVLAFRTDADRQGESNDVVAWPPSFDPRARMLVPGMIMGLVSKLRFYSTKGVGGFTATVRRIYQFVKGRGYPRRWWLRPLAVALLRVGVAPACLPRILRTVLSCRMKQPMYDSDERNPASVQENEDATEGGIVPLTSRRSFCVVGKN